MWYDYAFAQIGPRRHRRCCFPRRRMGMHSGSDIKRTEFLGGYHTATFQFERSREQSGRYGPGAETATAACPNVIASPDHFVVLAAQHQLCDHADFVAAWNKSGYPARVTHDGEARAHVRSGFQQTWYRWH